MTTAMNVLEGIEQASRRYRLFQTALSTQADYDGYSRDSVKQERTEDTGFCAERCASKEVATLTL